MSQNVKISFETEKSIIDMVRDRPNLFVTKHKDYKCKTTRENSWKFIADTIGLESGEAASKIWDNLRNQYCAFLRKISKSTGSGASRSISFRHEKLMAFYKDPENKYSSEYSNIPSQMSLESEAQFNLVDENEEIVDENVILVSSQIPSSSPVQTNYKSRPHKRKSGELDEKILKALEENESELDSYAKVIASKLKKIEESDKIIFLTAQKNINDIIFNAEVEALLKK